MRHIVAKQNEDDTWDIEIQTIYASRPMIIRIPRGTIAIEALKVDSGHDLTIEVHDEMAVCWGER